jgi:hypothetical protein
MAMNSYEWVESLRVINCMEKEDFQECFGSSGTYLWGRFLDKKQDIFEFLSYLDSVNAETLFKYCLMRIEESKFKRLSS